MNMAIWILAGGIIGWVAYSHLHYSEDRGRNVSVAIGAAGGFLGGQLVAPMFSAAGLPGAFSLSALLFAGAIAAACLFVGNLVYNRWGV